MPPSLGTRCRPAVAVCHMPSELYLFEADKLHAARVNFWQLNFSTSLTNLANFFAVSPIPPGLSFLPVHWPQPTPTRYSPRE